MQLTVALASLLFIPTVCAVFRDEVGSIDYHHQLIGLPQKSNTFFHRPRKTEKASLLYTLSDIGIIGAVNPGNGQVVWRQPIADADSATTGHLRAAEGEAWICSAHGGSVHAWDAIGGRSVWSAEFAGEARDLELISKDAVVLFQQDTFFSVRRLSGENGRVVWEYSETTADVPLQVSTSDEKVFVVSLRGHSGEYSLKVTVVDATTGSKKDDIHIDTRGRIQTASQVVFVGSNSAGPIVAWTDPALSKLNINILGASDSHEISLVADATAVEIYAPRLSQPQPHLLVYTRTAAGNMGDIYSVGNVIKHIYEMPLLPGPGAFSIDSVGDHVYVTRITPDEVIITSSASDQVLARWNLKSPKGSVGIINALCAVSEVVKKSDGSYAVRTATVTVDDDWVLIRNGEQAWSRSEGMTGGIAAAFAEIPESATLAQNLELEAHSNPVQAFAHRCTRHLAHLQYLPAYLATLPVSLVSSVLGAETKPAPFTRDNFGFHKLVILATRRGKLYCLDTGSNGNIFWQIRASILPKGEAWDVKALFVEAETKQVTVLDSKGDQIVVRLTDAHIVEASSRPPVQSAAIVDSPAGSWILPIGPGGTAGPISAEWQPKDILVVRGEQGELKGLLFSGQSLDGMGSWNFSAPTGQEVLSLASRRPHDPIASIGKVLGDRSVLYKYLNPNTVVVATGDKTASTMTVYLLDTVSGQVLSSHTYSGVDVSRPVECAMAENFFLCTFFGQFSLHENKTQFIKGWQLVISDLYESELPNYRGSLGNAGNFSSLRPVDTPTSPPLPHVVSQAFILGAPLSALMVSETRQGISTRQILAYAADMHSIIGIPRPVLEPRRPVGRDPTVVEKEEGLVRYAPAIEIDPRLVITHERDVVGVRSIVTTSTILESTALVFAYGVDVFGTRLTPSFSFDVLGKGFNKVSLVLTVAALFAGVLALGPVVRKKKINTGWGGAA